MKFDEVDLIEPIRTALKKIGVSEMTEIQEKAIPILFQKKEVIAKAPTGTGKTYAFGIPIITEIDPELEATQALILCPTRELCTQLRDEMRALSQDMPQIRVAAVYGGQPIRRQIEALQKNPQIVVATPGRLIDHYKHRNIRLNRVAVTILDEADEMLDMGFLRMSASFWISFRNETGFRCFRRRFHVLSWILAGFISVIRRRLWWSLSRKISRKLRSSDCAQPGRKKFLI